MTQPHRFTLRKLFPPSGAAYELWDCAVLLAALGGVGYAISNPPPNTEQTLTILGFIGEETLGWILAIAGAIGMVAAYTPWLRVGYISTITATATMSGFFAWGWVINQTDIRAVLSAVLYGWIARRLIRDGARDL